MKFPKKSAYSLIELSIVMLIISILITSGFSLASNSIANAKIKVTNERMSLIYQALGNYILQHRGLPCPARLDLISSDSNFGAEASRDSNGKCVASSGIYVSTSVDSSYADNLMYGTLPIRSLGLSNEIAEDGFGTKFSYIIDIRFAKYAATQTPSSQNDDFSTTVTNPSNTSANRYIKIINSPDIEITKDAIVTIVSHGANKLGGFNANSTTQNQIPADQYEQNNAINIANSPSFDDQFVQEVSDASGYDDMILFKRWQDFINDFSLMHMVPCRDGASRYYHGTTVYGNINCSGGNTITVPTKKCDAYGVMSSIASPSC